MTEMRILVVDDEPGTEARLADALARGGFAVETATTTGDGLSRPEKDGVDLLQEPRQQDLDVATIVVAARGAVDDAVPAADRAPSPRGGSLAGLTVREMERRLILDTLARTNHNRTRAAHLLGISIRTLRNKLATYRQRGELVVLAED